MSKAIVLDSGPLGLLCAPPRASGKAADCARWLSSHLVAGTKIYLPEIADYEVRRELIRANLTSSLERLDSLAKIVDYLALESVVMRRAAELWALARQTGQPTSGDKTIDADIILVAQSESIHSANAIIATTNVGHLARFSDARIWSDIQP